MKAVATLLAVTSAVLAAPKTYTHPSHNGKYQTVLEANEPTLCDPTVQQYSGYFDANGNDKYFYWFFESRTDPSNAPLIMWLTGGPGCSSQLALLAENGPCTVNDFATGTIPNEYSWNSNANIMWVDQPPGTGFSTGTPDKTEAEIAQDMYDFLQNFMAAFPQYFANGFFVFGESYAGHYVPSITNYIFQQNQQSGATQIPLVAFAIGNGLTDPYVQYAWYATMAYNSTTAPSVISHADYEFMTRHIPECQSMIADCNKNDDSTACADAVDYCNIYEMEPVTITGINPYDLRIPCEVPGLCYNFTTVDIWLNNETVQAAIGVNKKWESCDNAVHVALTADWMQDYQDDVTPMIEGGIRGLIYAGDQDFICNWLGNKHWALELDWSGQSGFQAAQDEKWSDMGIVRTYQNFTFLQVFQAGHMVPMDQPEAALDMVNQWVTNTLVPQ